MIAAATAANAWVIKSYGAGWIAESWMRTAAEMMGCVLYRDCRDGGTVK